MTLREQQIKIELNEAIGDFLDSDTLNGEFGYLPNNISETMTDAAFAVLMAVSGTNDYFRDEGMLK